jgi:hypothetical protein
MIRQRFRTALALLIVCAGAIASTALVTFPARAATVPISASAATGQLATALASAPANAAISSAPGVTRSAVALEITCTISVDNPHNSSHVGGVVNVLARINCTAPVASLSTNLLLARDGVVVGSRANSNAGVAALSNSVAVPCVSGVYQAGVVGGVVFPPGFVPPGGVISALSNVVLITC